MTFPTCAVTGILRTPAGVAINGALVTAALVGVDTFDGLVLPVLVQTTTDTAGEFTLTLFQNEAGTQASHYQLRFTDAATGMPLADRLRIYTPAETAAAVDDILLTDDNPPMPASGPVRAFNGRTGHVTLTGSDVSGAGGALAVGTATVVDTIMAASASGLADGATIIARGRSTVRDGAGGVFEYWASSAATSDNGLIFTPVGTTGNGRFIRHGYTVFGFSGKANAAWWGLKADCVGFTGTDNTAALAAAMRAASSIELPPGRFLFKNNAAERLLFTRHTAMTGAGMLGTELVFDDDSGASRRDMFGSNGLGAWNLELSEFSIVGSWGNGGNWATKSHIMEVIGVGDVTLSRLRVYGSRFMGLVFTGCKAFSAAGCELERTVADGLRVTGYQSAIASYCKFKNVNDDAVAFHTPDASALPSDCSAVVIGCTFVDSQGVAILGSKNAVVQGCVFTRPHCRAIYVGQEDGSEEGNTPLLGVSIAGNIIDTIFKGTVFSGASGGLWSPITVRAEPLGAVPGGGYPGRPDGAGGIVPLALYLYLGNTDDDGAGLNAGVQSVRIMGNVVGRTLDPVGAYSDYGFGVRYGRSGPVDPAITADDLGIGTFGIGCVAVLGGANRVAVEGNTLTAGYRHAGYFGNVGSAPPYIAFPSSSFSANECLHFTASGLFLEAPGAYKASGNNFSGDPFHTDPARLPAGKWASSGGPLGIYAAGGSSVQAGGNHYRHIQSVSATGESATIQHTGETIYCQPVGIGWNADNAGIGTIPRPSEIGATLVIEDANPSSATYGKVLSRCPGATSATPTAGTWIAGMFVSDSAAAQLNHGGKLYIRHGWSRRTTGSAHVPGTDWVDSLTPVNP